MIKAAFKFNIWVLALFLVTVVPSFGSSSDRQTFLSTCHNYLMGAVTRARLGHQFGQEKTKGGIQLARTLALQHWASFEAPEHLEGLSMDEALLKLKSLKQAILQKQTVVERVNEKVVAHQAVADGEPSGIVGLLKSPSKTSLPTRDYVFQITTRPRSEMVLFLVDRLFGFNVVAPTIMLDEERSLQLKIHESHLAKNFGEFSSLSAFMTRYYLLILDAFAVNKDRTDNPGNTRMRNDDHVLGVDFDLAGTKTIIRDGVQFDFLKKMSVKIEGSSYDLPLMTSRRVYNQLKSITKESIREFSRQNDFEFYDFEVNRIYGYAQGLIIYLDHVINIYGEDLILFDEAV